MRTDTNTPIRIRTRTASTHRARAAGLATLQSFVAREPPFLRRSLPFNLLSNPRNSILHLQNPNPSSPRRASSLLPLHAAPPRLLRPPEPKRPPDGALADLGFARARSPLLGPRPCGAVAVGACGGGEIGRGGGGGGDEMRRRGGGGGGGGDGHE